MISNLFALYFCVFWRIVLASASPNIIFILLDDLGYQDISAYGGEYDTPNLDSLYSDGIRLNYHYVGTKCSVTRSQFLTGRYAHRMGFAKMEAFGGRLPISIPLGIPTIGNLLQEYANYKTYAVGKWQVGAALDEMWPLERGFDHWYGGYIGSNTGYTTKTRTDDTSGIDAYDWFNDDTLDVDTLDVQATKAQTGFVVDIIEDNVNNNKPFFVFAAFQVPHSRLLAVNSSQVDNCAVVDDTDGFQRERLCENVQVLDVGMGKIEKALKENGMWNNTIIVFTSDNGGPVRPRVSGCNYPFRGGKSSYFEGGIRTIAFVTGGYIDESQRGTERDDLVYISDWLPTFLTIANVDVKTVENDLLKRAYGISDLTNNSENITAFDGLDLSNRIFYNTTDENSRNFIPFNAAQFNDTENDVAMMYRNPNDGHLYKYLYLQYTFNFSIGYSKIEVSPYNSSKTVISYYEIDTATIKPEMLFDITIDANETTNLINNGNYSDIKQDLINLAYNELNSNMYVFNIGDCMEQYSGTENLPVQVTIDNTDYWIYSPFVTSLDIYYQNITQYCGNLTGFARQIFYNVYNGTETYMDDTTSTTMYDDSGSSSGSGTSSGGSTMQTTADSGNGNSDTDNANIINVNHIIKLICFFSLVTYACIV